MKKIILCCFFLYAALGFSQYKDFTVVDLITQQPINLVQVLYPNLEIGSVSNADGKVRIPLHKEKLLFSHINYKEQQLLYSAFANKDTIFLKPNTNELDEVVLYNINLLKKLTNVLDNTYFKEYVTKKAIHNATYKETFSVNDSLTRLFQVQLNWWSKNGLFRMDKSITKQNKLHLASVDYSKIKKEAHVLGSNGAYVENAVFFQYAHLNLLLSITKDLGYDFEINEIVKNGNAVNVYFDAVLKQKGAIIYRHKNSLVVFNEDYSHIKQVKFNMVYATDFESGYSERTKMSYQKKTTKHVLELAFKPTKYDKLALSYYSSEIFAMIKTDSFTENVSSKQSLFVNKSEFGKNLKEKEINFYKPFYENITADKNAKDVQILLTKAEKAFLKN